MRRLQKFKPSLLLLVDARKFGVQDQERRCFWSSSGLPRRCSPSAAESRRRLAGPGSEAFTLQARVRIPPSTVLFATRGRGEGVGRRRRRQPRRRGVGVRKKRRFAKNKTTERGGESVRRTTRVHTSPPTAAALVLFEREVLVFRALRRDDEQIHAVTLRTAAQPNE